MSYRESSWSASLNCRRVLYGRWDVSVQVSMRRSSGTLQSPPRIRMPVWKDDSRRLIDRKNGTWAVLGLYTLARVIGVSHSLPLMKM